MKKVITNENQLKIGAEILTERPFAYILNSKQVQHRCDYCFNKSELLTCSSCNAIRYCNKICQKKGWYFHKRECKNMKRIAPKILPDAARLLARIIYKLDNGGAREQCFYSSRQFRVFLDLMSHYNDIKNDMKRMEHFESLYVVLTSFFGDETLPNPVELLRIYGKMVVNTYCILDAEMQSIGSGMYIAASVIDHSCTPNAVAIFNGTTLSIKTLVDIKDNVDWNKVFISYIDLMKITDDRRKDLQTTYYFTCECTRCNDFEEPRLMTATVCQDENCRMTVLSGSEDRNAQCVKCKECVKPCDWQKIKDVISFTDQQLEVMKDISYLDVCRMCLKKQEGILDDLNIKRVQVLDIAMESSIELELWEAAAEFGQKLINPFRRYYGVYHPLTGILLMKLGKLALYLSKMNDARRWLKEAKEILVVTHGIKHPLVCEELVSYIQQCNY